MAADQAATISRTRLSEDWTAVVVGFLIIIISLLIYVIPTPTFSWSSGSDLTGKVFDPANLIKTIIQFAAVYIAGAIAVVIAGKSLPNFSRMFGVVALITWFALIVSGNSAMKGLNLESVIFSLALGLLIGNFVDLPTWFREALSTEVFVKIGLVLLGTGVLFSDILRAGSLGLIQALIVVISVWYFAYWLCKKLKLDDELSMMLSSAVSICGVSAAIATAGAIKGDPKKLSYVISLVLVTAIPMMLFMPYIASMLGWSQEVTGAWLGGTIDTTGAVVASGTLVGEDKDWGWWTAWLNLGGQISIVAGINYAAAFYIGATILGPLFGFDPNAETAGLTNAIWLTGLLMLIEIGFNVAGTRIVATMNDISVWWHIGLVIAIAVCLFALGSQPTHPVDFLFQVAPGGTAPDGAAWADILPFGIAGAFALSLLQSQWTYTGYDASAHVAEETVQARVASAWGVFLSVAVSAVFGYIVLVALTLKMTTPADVLAGSTGGGGVAYILEANLGAGLNQLGGLLAAGIAIAMTFCGFSSIASAGRMLFAFSRDDGVPGSRWLKKVSTRFRTPSIAVVSITVASWLLIALIYVLTKALGGDPFFIIAGVTGVSTVLLYWAYGLCIGLALWGDQSWRLERKWSLGGMSKPAAFISVVWIILITPLFLYPFPLNSAALITVAAFLVLLAIYYVVWARTRFYGPRRQGTDAELTEIEREFERAAGELGTATA